MPIGFACNIIQCNVKWVECLLDDVIKLSHTMEVKYKVVMKNKVRRLAERMPKGMQDRLDILVRDLEENGAIRKD